LVGVDVPVPSTSQSRTGTSAFSICVLSYEQQIDVRLQIPADRVATARMPEWRTANANVEGSGWARYLPVKGWTAAAGMRILLHRVGLLAGLTAQRFAL
jgi:hypothetical protein